jgi:hypothetical protein
MESEQGTGMTSRGVPVDKCQNKQDIISKSSLELCLLPKKDHANVAGTM